MEAPGVVRGEGLALRALAAPHDGWLPIPMPGKVYRVEQDAGCIPQPFFRPQRESHRLDGEPRVVVPHRL